MRTTWTTSAAGLALAVTVFSTVYRIGPVLLYPRMLVAVLGVWVLTRHPQLRTLVALPALLIGSVIAALLAAGMNNEWDHLALLLSQLTRGIVLPYFCAVALAGMLGLLDAPDAEDVREKIVRVACVALLIQALMSMAQVTLPAFREAFLSIVNLADSWRKEADGGHFRFSGIGGISIYDTSIAYCVLAAVLLNANPPRHKADAWLRASALAALLVLGLLHGRTGLLLGLSLTGWLLLRETLQRFTAAQPLLVGPRLLLLACILASTLYLGLDEALRDLILNFGGELLVNLVAGEGLRSDSTDDFFDNHLHLPDGNVLIGGAGYWGQPELADEKGRAYSTDSGVLLLLNFGGVPLLLATFLGIGTMLSMLHGRIAGDGQASAGPGQAGLALYLSTVFVLVSWKGPIFFSEHFMTALFFVVVSAASVHRAAAMRLPLLGRNGPSNGRAPISTT